MQHFYSFTSANRIFKCANVSRSVSNRMMKCSWAKIFSHCSFCHWVSVYCKLFRMMTFILLLRLWNCRATVDDCLYDFAIFSFSYDFRFACMGKKIDAQQSRRHSSNTRTCKMPYSKSVNDLAQHSEWEDWKFLFTTQHCQHKQTFRRSFRYDLIHSTVIPANFAGMIFVFLMFIESFRRTQIHNEKKKKNNLFRMILFNLLCLRFLFCSEVVDLCG